MDGRHANLGFALAQQGDVGGAERAYTRALGLDPDHVNALLNYGVLQSATGRLEDATTTFRKLLRLEPTNLEASKNLARSLNLQNLGSEAEGVLEQPREDLGLFLVLAHKPAEGLAQLQAARRGGADSAELRFRIGWALTDLGRSAAARRELEAALKMDPGHEEARGRLAALADQVENER